MAPLTIREVTNEDLPAVLDVERRAFGQETEAQLVRALLADPSAAPCLSLLADVDGRPVAHVLFTAVTVGTAPVAAAILAPLAVLPEAQGQGVGTRLVEDALGRLVASGTALAFVLGDPGYYGRFGFQPAGRLGFAAPYPIPEAHADAWMVRELRAGTIGQVAGRIRCADALDRPELWQE